MSSTLIDSDVLIDLFDDRSEWHGWSAAVIAQRRNRGQLVINPIVFAEVSMGFHSYEAVDAHLPEDWVRREPLPWDAAFLAAHAFLLYRQPAASAVHRCRISISAVAGHTLLTRDPRRYRHYFPKLRIVAP